MKELIENLENLDKTLTTNKDVDWTENDPSEEFNSLSYLVREIIKRAKESIPTERQQKLEKLSEYVFAEDDEDLDRMLTLLENHKDVKDISGWVEGVQMTEQFETSFTVSDLLDHIS